VQRFVRRVSAIVVVALGVVSTFACGELGVSEDDDELREDVISCEDALARLEACCPDFDITRVYCTYYSYRSNGCARTSSAREVRPALSLPESECVRATSCAALVESGVCARAQVAPTYESTSGIDAPSVSTGHPPVCP
jgi:hypothetical protein